MLKVKPCKTEEDIDEKTDCRNPHQIIMTDPGDSLICNLAFYHMNIH